MKFSKNYRKFEEWLVVNDKKTAYTRRIERLHSLYPNANLSQLRGHTKQSTQSLSAKVAKPLHKRSWNTLSPKERLSRETALDVLNKARQSSQSLTQIARQHNTSASKVLNATHGFNKVNGRWRPKSVDRLSRVMAINENGKDRFIEITNSSYATILGKYYNAVKDYLNNGNFDALAEFRGMQIKDSSGNSHILETDPKAIVEINERREEPEFYDIYKVD